MFEVKVLSIYNYNFTFKINLLFIITFDFTLVTPNLSCSLHLNF